MTPPDDRPPREDVAFDVDEWLAERDAADRRRAERRGSRPPREGGRATRLVGMAAPGLPAVLETRAGRVLGGLALTLAVLTVAGLAALWPGDVPQGPPAMGGATVSAEVQRTVTVDCGGPQAQDCVAIDVRIEGREGTERITLGPAGAVPDLGSGDAIRVAPVHAPGAIDAEPYSYVDRDRRTPMVVLLVIFAVLVVVLARWRGALALAGFALSLLLVTQFLVPAMLAGEPPVLVALAGGLAVMWVTLLLTYGLGPQTLAAAVGVGATLGLAALLGSAWVDLAALDGHTGEVASVFGVQEGQSISLQGIVLAGMVIGALGVLADTAVTQVSAVMALRHADPRLGAGALYRAAFAIGRDHLTATVHTLVLAYVGAGLPSVLLIAYADLPAGDALNAQELADPIVGTLVGGIALLASVPVATGLAALVVSRIPAAALPHGGHGHAH